MRGTSGSAHGLVNRRPWKRGRGTSPVAGGFVRVAGPRRLQRQHGRVPARPMVGRRFPAGRPSARASRRIVAYNPALDIGTRATAWGSLMRLAYPPHRTVPSGVNAHRHRSRAGSNGARIRFPLILTLTGKDARARIAPFGDLSARGRRFFSAAVNRRLFLTSREVKAKCAAGPNER